MGEPGDDDDRRRSDLLRPGAGGGRCAAPQGHPADVPSPPSPGGENPPSPGGEIPPPPGAHPPAAPPPSPVLEPLFDNALVPKSHFAEAPPLQLASVELAERPPRPESDFTPMPVPDRPVRPHLAGHSLVPLVPRPLAAGHRRRGRLHRHHRPLDRGPYPCPGSAGPAATRHARPGAVGKAEEARAGATGEARGHTCAVAAGAQRAFGSDGAGRGEPRWARRPGRATTSGPRARSASRSASRVTAASRRRWRVVPSGRWTRRFDGAETASAARFSRDGPRRPP